ncbi:hypothetical protein EDD16DRAFT_1622302 [Pisolithus croceorrhizus]|nr:hypothetical protein EDD16DRAFT_1622302 [Pisolithus croceorrhizus]
MRVACDCILRSLPPQLRSALGAALLHPQTLTVASVLPRCVGLHCPHDLQDLLIMKRNMSCVSVALLHPRFQVPYRPANIHPSKMVGIADHRGVRPIEFGKVIVNSPNSSSSLRRLSRPHRDDIDPVYSATDSSTSSRNSMVMGSESWRCHSRITHVRHVLNHEVMLRRCQRTGQICLRKAFTPTPRSTCRQSGASCSISRVVIVVSGTNPSLAFRDEKSASGYLACMHARCAHNFPATCQGSNGP